MPKVDWHCIVWFKNRIPRHSFILWLTMLNRLSTQKRMIKWKIGTGDRCPFCKTVQDSRSHLFFDCKFPNQIWKEMMCKADFGTLPDKWRDLIGKLQDCLKKDNGENLIRKLVFAATVYHIWRERNWRLLKKIENDEDKVVKLISEDVKLKIISLGLGFKGIKEETKVKWGIHNPKNDVNDDR